MSIRNYKQFSPQLGARVYIDQQATVIGDVHLNDDVSIWPTTVLRGDVNSIHIGQRSNIQDGTVCHVTHKSPTNPRGYALEIGDDVTVGHQAVLHACRIADQCLIGMGSLLLDNCVLEPHVLLGAGSLVPPGVTLQGGYLWLGRPAKKIRALAEEEMAYFCYSSQHYVRLKNDYLSEQQQEEG